MSLDESIQAIYLIADQLRGSGTLGVHFATNSYELERGELMLASADELTALAHAIHGDPTGAPLDVFDDEGARRISPALAVEAIVLDHDGQVLLARRRDSRAWCMPGGICEIGQSPPEAALRELWEEAGIRGEIDRLLGVFDGRLWGTRSTVHLVLLVYLIRAAGLTPSPGTEMLDTAFFAPDALPSDLHPGHDQRLRHCLELTRTGRVHHDAADTSDGNLSLHQRPI